MPNEQESQKIIHHTHNGIDSPQIDFESVLNFEDSWDRFFIYRTFFDSVDGYTKTGTVTVDGTGVTINSGATNSSIVKEPLIQAAQGAFDFAEHSRIRFGIEFGSGSLSNSESSFSFGTFGSGENYYGFNTVNGTLQGSCSNANGSTVITLETISAATSYELEARFYPNKMVKFFRDGNFKGLIRNSLPTGLSANMFASNIKNNSGTAKTVTMSYVEILQQRIR